MLQIQVYHYETVGESSLKTYEAGLPKTDQDH